MAIEEELADYVDRWENAPIPLVLTDKALEALEIMTGRLG